MMGGHNFRPFVPLRGDRAYPAVNCDPGFHAQAAALKALSRRTSLPSSPSVLPDITN